MVRSNGRGSRFRQAIAAAARVKPPPITQIFGRVRFICVPKTGQHGGAGKKPPPLDQGRRSGSGGDYSPALPVHMHAHTEASYRCTIEASNRGAAVLYGYTRGVGRYGGLGIATQL